MHAHRPVIILSTVHCSPWRTPFATTPHVDTARKACPGTAQWARFPSSEVTQEVTSIRIQKLDPLSGAFANTPVTEGDPLQTVTVFARRRDHLDARSQPALREPAVRRRTRDRLEIVPGERCLPVPDRS